MIELLDTFSVAILPAFLLLDMAWRARRYRTTSLWRLRGLAVGIGVYFLWCSAPSATRAASTGSRPDSIRGPRPGSAAC